MNTELDDRLRALGSHLDAERAALRADTNVVSINAKRRTNVRLVAAVAASVAVVAGLVAIATNRIGDPDRNAPATVQPTVVSTPPTVAVDTTTPPTTATPSSASAAGTPSGTGTLTIDFVLGTSDPNSRLHAVDAMRAWARALDLDATVSVDEQLHVVVPHVAAAAVEEVADLLGDLARPVQLRPVTKDCTTSSVRPPPNNTDDLSTMVMPFVGSDPPQACTVGPSLGDGTVFAGDATASTPDVVGPAVTVSLRPGAAGEDIWNALATHCYNADDVCPTRRLAIVLGGQIFSAATVLTPTFSGSVQIAGQFDDLHVKALVQILNHGPATVSLDPHGATWHTDP